jgi:hypothetical protein
MSLWDKSYGQIGSFIRRLEKAGMTPEKFDLFLKEDGVAALWVKKFAQAMDGDWGMSPSAFHYLGVKYSS